jgi:hypothetical protein
MVGIRVETVLTFIDDEGKDGWKSVMPSGSRADAIHDRHPTHLCRIKGPLHDPYWLLRDGKTSRKEPR